MVFYQQIENILTLVRDVSREYIIKPLQDRCHVINWIQQWRDKTILDKRDKWSPLYTSPILMIQEHVNFHVKLNQANKEQTAKRQKTIYFGICSSMRWFPTR